jgi:ankyrin repeat protein
MTSSRIGVATSAANLLLRSAAASLNPVLVQCALDIGASPLSTSALDRTAIMLAIMNGGDHAATLNVVIRLVASDGTAVNHQSATAGLTALMLAALLGMPAVVQALIEAGAKVRLDYTPPWPHLVLSATAPTLRTTWYRSSRIRLL